MRDMKKHQFLEVDFLATVTLTSAESRQVKKYLKLASVVLEKFLKKTSPLLSKEKFSVVKMSLMVCGDSRMKELNLETRGKNKITDVLSFPYHENLRKNKGRVTLEDTLYLGEIAICHPQTKRQAKSFDIGYGDEFIHLFFHGVLHLMGFDHEASVKEEKMQQKWEDWLLEEFSKVKKSFGR
jgi:probable rRNA maturation factor